MSRKRKQKIEKTPVKADITALSHDGRGIAKLDGKTTFIRGGLPGETVEFIYSRKSAKFDEGQVSEVLSPAANRVEPPCEFFGLCGACNFQHLNPSDQIQHKQTVLLEQLKHIAGTEPAEILPPLTAETEGYRRKARLGVRYVRKKERVLVGFREIAGRYLADMRSCKILHPSVGQELQALAELIQSLSLYEEIPQIEVAVGDDATALVFRHLKPLPEEDQTALIEFAKPKGLHIYLQSGGPETVKQIYPMPATNRLSYHLLDQSLTLQFHPNDFTQVNAAINQQMLTQALGLLDLKPNETALDLFCGLGNFSLALAKQCQHVTAIEGEKAMVERGYENAKLNGIDNITFPSSQPSQH